MKVICLVCKTAFNKAPSRIKVGWGKYCSRQCKNKDFKGKHLSPVTEIKQGQRLSITTEFKKGTPPPLHKLSCKCFRCLPLKKERHPYWKGGITPQNEIIRKSLLFKTWARQIKERDNFECQICGVRCQVGLGHRVYLRANHIKKFADYPEVRFELKNGITICNKCDLSLVMYHEEEWESYFNFNLMVRRIF